MLHSSDNFIDFAKTKSAHYAQTTAAKQRSSSTYVAWQLRFGKNRKTFPVKWSNHSLAGGYYYPP